MTVDDAVAAIAAGKLAVIPTDTVYGLACTPHDEEAARNVSRLKRRPPAQPIALVASSVDQLLECIPELQGNADAVTRALLPGPYTLVLQNPARRFPWLTGSAPVTIGVRVPELVGAGSDVLERVGVVAATSANRHGGADPRRLEEIPDEILAAVAAVVDGGELPGLPSTVIDLTGPEPRVLREGAVPKELALERVVAALAQ